MDWKRTGNSHCAELKIDGEVVVYFLIYDSIKNIELFVQIPPTRGFVKQKRTFETIGDAKEYVEYSFIEEVTL